MCHGFDSYDWSSKADEEPEEPEETADKPSFAADEPAEDVNILTDGGDEEDAE
ncbi:hypothetical protein [Halorientalis sp.]|jgi:hypothetical protein|uniref:hypothetical protein n=1 Tax=Halorientalis sp. TaxID=1931229 RepID=UPI00261CCEB1|nr:hypothetical protein [Halorientalis sp.]